MQKRPIVLGTGLITLDVVLNTRSKSQAKTFAGGTCGNVLAILGFLGWDSYPIARFNKDSAAQNVTADLQRWNVKVDFMNLEPSSDTPIIVQELKENRAGESYHTFSWTCPHCGAWLPPYRAVRISSVNSALERLPTPTVFFFDRVSPAALLLAEHCNANGAIVFFEPSGVTNMKHFKKAIELSHIVKYANDRAAEFKKLIASPNALVEIETLGKRGVRYRSSFGRTNEDKWVEVPSIETTLIDAAGAGDWFTAVLLNSIGRAGFPGLKGLPLQSISSAISAGQAAASWACMFEGARGGMYECSRKAFERSIEALLSKKVSNARGSKSSRVVSKREIFECPSCVA